MSKLPAVATAEQGRPTLNPLVPLLTEDRQKQLESLTPDEQAAFFGRVVSSVLTSDVYKKLAFETAASEFDKIAAERKSGTKKK